MIALSEWFIVVYAKHTPYISWHITTNSAFFMDTIE